MSRVMLIH